MNRIQAELVVDCGNSLGEGAFHDSKEGKLWWVEIAPPSKIFCLDLATGASRSWDMPEMVSYAVPRASGAMLVAAHGGLASFDPATGSYERVKQLEPMLPFNRSNDACCDPQGRLWVGTMQNNIAPDLGPIRLVADSGALYQVDAQYAVDQVVNDIGISNSLCFSPDATRMYFTDTLKQVIWQYDYDAASGAISNRRDFASHPDGGPDGATVDADGCVWSTRYGGSCVVRFTPDGKVDTLVELPCAQVTCCTFGGSDLRDLYITTARIDLDERQLAEQPQAGGLFKVRTQAQGVADVPFAG